MRSAVTFQRLLRVGVLLCLASPAGLAGAVIREYPLPTPNSGPTVIGGFSNYSLWFLEPHANKIGQRYPDGSIQEYSVPTPDSGLEGLTPHADVQGRFGFTEFRANKVGRIDPSGRITEFAIPTPNSGPRGIIVGDAHSFWFTEFNADKIGRLSYQGEIFEYGVFPGSGPLGITWGPSEDGNGEAWFTEFRGNRIGRLNPNSRLRAYSIPTPDSGPTGIAWDPVGGAVWFTEFNANKIGRITPDGVITEFSIPTPDSGPTGIVAGSDGGIWFTQSRANKIARLNRDGTFTEFPVPTPNSWPSGINSELWFTERDGNKLSRVGRETLVAVGAGFSGTWDTDFELANGENRAVRAAVGIPGPAICGVCNNPTRYLDIPANGTARVSAREVPFVSEAVQTFYVGLTGRIEIGELPTTRARVVNRARPTQAIEIPVVRFSRLEEMNPSVLAFPGATRSAAAHSNLVIAEVGVSRPITFRVEALDAAGTSLASREFFLRQGQTLFLIDVLQQLGVVELDRGQVRVTKVGGDGLMWGLLPTVYDDGRVTVSVGMNP